MPRPKNTFKPIKAYVPINIGNIDELVIGTNLSADRIRAIYHQLFLKRLIDSSNSKLILSAKYINGWVSIHSGILKKIGTNRYLEYLQFLENKGLLLIRRDEITGGKKYTKGLESAQFKIPNALLKSSGIKHFRKEIISEHTVLKSVEFLKESYRKSVKNLSLNPVHFQLKNMLSLIKFDTVGAEKFLNQIKNKEIVLKEKEEKQRSYSDILLLMDAINEGQYERITVDKFGERFHTPFTNLWKELRKFISFENNSSELISIDISNSQPYFSSIAIDSKLIDTILLEFNGIVPELKNIDMKQDFKLFSELCANGQIYEYWMDKRGLGKNEESRKQAKEELFMIMYDKPKKIINTKNSKRKEYYEKLKLFETTFPSVYMAFNKIKSLDEKTLPFITETFVNEYGMFEGKKSYYKSLSSMMQRMESRIIIQRISPKLIEAGLTPFITIHDSFIMPIEFVEKAKQIINNEFELLGVKAPNFKNEELKKSKDFTS